MCDACVIQSVRQRMLSQGTLSQGTLSQRPLSQRTLSRRQMLKTAAAGAVTAAGIGAVAPAAQAMTLEAVSDLTHELHEDFPTFFGEQQFFKDRKFNYAEHKFNLFELRLNEHTGTHVDAPLHFSEDGQSVAEIPVENLVVPLCVIDIRARAAGNPDAQLTPDDLKAWIAAHGPIPERACVAMNSGWSQHVNSAMFRNADGATGMHFPGFHTEAATMLLEETSAVGMAVDTLSLDFGQSQDFAVHYAWLPEGRWGIECIANLDAIPPAGATLVVGAPKHRGGTGGPARVFAMV